jgi:hypothetical protein
MIDLFHNKRFSFDSTSICIDYVSNDGIRWYEVEVSGVSPNGINFFSTLSFDTEKVLKHDLYVYSKVTKFDFSLDGYIVEKKAVHNGYCYNVRFKNIDELTRIQLDEILNINKSLFFIP